MKCNRCGWDLGSCDIHHINGKKIENCNEHFNLTYVCPNCHRLIHEGKIQKSELISLDKILPENWIDLYFEYLSYDYFINFDDFLKDISLSFDINLQ